MGVLFSKPKKSEEPSSRSDSIISLQKVNMREPDAGAEENQILLQENLNPVYESTVVAIPTERNIPVAENPKAENYFLSTEKVWGRVFSFCSMTDLLQMRLVSPFFLKIIQNHNQDDHVSFLWHIISFISIVRLFSLGRDQDQALRLLFSKSSTAIRLELITNPFVTINPFVSQGNEEATHISILCILLRDALKRDSLFPISIQDVSGALHSLSNIDKNIQKRHFNVYDNCCEQRLLSFRGGKQRLPLNLSVLISLTVMTVVPAAFTAFLLILFSLSKSDDTHVIKMKAVIISSVSFLVHALFTIYCCTGEVLPKNFSKTIIATKEQQQAIFKRLDNDIQFFKNKLNPPTEEARERTDSIAVPIPHKI